MAVIAQRPVLDSGALPRSAKAALPLLAVLCAGASPAGLAMITAVPGEPVLGMSLEWLKGTPFTSYFIPGLFLAGLFGLGSAVAIALTLLRHWLAPHAVFAIGVGQMIWITVQYAMLYSLGVHPLQPTMFVLGALLALCSFTWWKATRQLA